METDADAVAVLDAATEQSESNTVTVLDAEPRPPWGVSVLHETLMQHAEADGLPVPDGTTTAALVAKFGWAAICAAIVDIIVWKHIGFPRMPSPEKKARRAFHKLLKTARSTILKIGEGANYVSECTYRHWNTATQLGFIGLGAGSNIISDHFQWENRLRCRGYDSKSPLEIWEKEEFLRAVKWIFSSFAEERAEMGIRRGDYTGTFRLRSYTATQFRPQVAKAFMDLYAAGGVVLDISCGWGDRLAGFYASRACQYIGCDPNRACFPIYLVQALAYERWLDPRVIPTVERFVTKNGHDAFCVTGSKVVTIICGPAEDIDWHVQVDLILSSPPYFNTERYAEEQGADASALQSWSRYQDIEAWRNGFLYAAVDRARAVLRPGGVLALNIADPTVGDQRFEVCDRLIDRLTDQGMVFTGVVAMAVKNRPSPDPEAEGAAKKFAEPVFILTNGPREVRTFEPKDVLALYKKYERHRVDGWLCLLQAGMILDDHLHDHDFEAATELTKRQIERARYYHRAWKASGSPGGRDAPEVPEAWEKLRSIKGEGGLSVDKQIQAMGVENPRGATSPTKKAKAASAVVTNGATNPAANSADTGSVTTAGVTVGTAGTVADQTPPGVQIPDTCGTATPTLLDLVDHLRQITAVRQEVEAAVLAAIAVAGQDQIAVLRAQNLDDLPQVRDAVCGTEASAETVAFDAMMWVIKEVDERTAGTAESTASIIARDRVVQKVSDGTARIGWGEDHRDPGVYGDAVNVAPRGNLSIPVPTVDLKCGGTFVSELRPASTLAGTDESTATEKASGGTARIMRDRPNPVAVVGGGLLDIVNAARAPAQAARDAEAAAVAAMQVATPEELNRLWKADLDDLPGVVDALWSLREQTSGLSPDLQMPARVPTAEFRCGDAFVELTKLPPGSVNCIPFSPPYFHTKKNYRTSDANVLGNEQTVDEYVAKILHLLVLMTAALCDEGVIALNLGDHWVGRGEKGERGSALAIPQRIAAVVAGGAVPGLYLVQEIAWKRDHSRGVRGIEGRVSETIEAVLIFAKQPRTHAFFPDRCRTPLKASTKAAFGQALRRGMTVEEATRKIGNPRGAYPGDLWDHRHEYQRNGHPCPFPVALVDHILRLYCPAGGTVCDPFVGSGSSAVAAARLGLDFIGFDLNPAYIETARRRWDAEFEWAEIGWLCGTPEADAEIAEHAAEIAEHEGEDQDEEPREVEVFVPWRLRRRSTPNAGSPASRIRVASNQARPRGRP